MRRAIIAFGVLGTVMSAIAAGLMLYIASAIFANQIYPLMGQGQLEAALVPVLGIEFTGAWALFPVFMYLLLGFFALALGVRQANRTVRAWRGESEQGSDEA